jgi:hypothetical protein
VTAIFVYLAARFYGDLYVLSFLRIRSNGYQDVSAPLLLLIDICCTASSSQLNQ